MFTNMVVAFINFISFIIDGFFPKFSLDQQILDNASEAVSVLNDFLTSVNFIVPLPDIVMIVGLNLGIHIFKMTLFIGNKIGKTILSVIP